MPPFRSKPFSHATAGSVGTSGEKFAIPTTFPCRTVRVNVSAAAFVGFGNATSVPAAATTNVVHQAAGTTDYIFDGVPSTDGAYVYVYSLTSTIAVYVSFLG